MKIALDGRLLSFSSGGGISLYIDKILRFLISSTEHEVVLFVRAGIDADALQIEPKDRARLSIVAVDTEDKHLYTRVIPSELKHRDVDLYHATANWGISEQMQGIVKLLTLHDVIPFGFREAGYLDDDFFAYYQESLSSAISHADAIVTVSNYSKKEIIKHFGIAEDKVSVIYNGVDLNAGILPPDLKERLLIRYGLGEEAFFVYVGGFYERKNVASLVKAFNQLKSEYPEIKLVLTGDNSSGPYVQQQYAKLSADLEDGKANIITTGYIERVELDTLIASSLGLIYPSFYEGFGLPLLEAMNLGAPALGSNNTVLPEIGGDAGLYFDPYDVDDLLSAMRRVIQEPELRTEMIRLGHQRVEDFSWESSCHQVLSLYQELMRLQAE